MPGIAETTLGLGSAAASRAPAAHRIGRPAPLDAAETAASADARDPQLLAAIGIEPAIIESVRAVATSVYELPMLT